MYNKVILMGYLTRNPELKHSSKGTAVCRIGIASNQKMRDREETLFIDAVSFGKTAENINNYFSKGKPILIEGRIVFNTWVDKNGQKRSKHEIVIERFKFLLNKKNENKNHSSNTLNDNKEQINGEPDNKEEINDDDIPF